MDRQSSELIEKAIGANDWTGARRLINAARKRSPKDHWLMSRLALTYYEQRQYQKALEWDALALQEAPYCPLAIWGYAGALEMLRREREALALYRWLLIRGEEAIAYGECGEGIRWARGLLADCHYRIARIWEGRRQWKRASAEYEQYLTCRAERHASIYRLRDVRTHYERVLARIRS